MTSHSHTHSVTSTVTSHSHRHQHSDITLTHSQRQQHSDITLTHSQRHQHSDITLTHTLTAALSNVTDAQQGHQPPHVHRQFRASHKQTHACARPHPTFLKIHFNNIPQLRCQFKRILPLLSFRPKLCINSQSFYATRPSYPPLFHN